MMYRKTAGRWLAIILIATTALVSGCNRVSSETAAQKYAEGQRYEQQNDLPHALAAYQVAMNGDFPEHAQALANLGRVAVAEKKYDVAVQSYTLLSQNSPDAFVNTNPPGQPENKVQIRNWIGTFTDQKPDGPLWQAEEAQDQANRGKIAYKAMDFLVNLTGRNPYYSYALAILIFTIVVKAAMTPLTVMQFHSTRKMTAVQPKMKALQEKYKDKPEEMNRAVMGLYKEEGVNPLGCGASMIIQFPILIALYQVIRLYNFQFRNAYFLWVNPSTHTLAPAIIGKNLAQPDIILLVLYAFSMFLSQKLTIMPAQDEQQRQQQMMMAYMMPIMFLWVLKTFPSAFILYWLAFNAFTTWQQWSLLKKNPPPPPGELVTETGPAAPTEPVKRSPNRTPPKRKKK